MTNRYLYITLLAILGFNTDALSQSTQSKGTPRLVISITIDQLRTDYLEAFTPLYSEGGFKRLLKDGMVFSNVSYPFAPTDRASAIAAISTGTGMRRRPEVHRHADSRNGFTFRTFHFYTWR